LLAQSARHADALLRANAGSNSAARMAMMAMTTNSSMSVKAPPGLWAVKRAIREA
jgi:hypothetical protein